MLSFLPQMYKLAEYLTGTIILMIWDQCFAVTKKVLSPSTLNLWIMTELHPAMHLVSCAMLTNEQLLTIKALCLSNTVQDLMVSLLINGETPGNFLLLGCLFRGKYYVYIELYVHLNDLSI